MTEPVQGLANIIKEIEEVDGCIADLEADQRRNPDSIAGRHARFGAKALRRYRARLVADRDAELAKLEG
jgi:hypothetical protein